MKLYKTGELLLKKENFFSGTVIALALPCQSSFPLDVFTPDSVMSIGTQHFPQDNMPSEDSDQTAHLCSLQRLIRLHGGTS